MNTSLEKELRTWHTYVSY